MPTNDFLPVATDVGANVELQAAYAADAVVPVGFALNAVPPSSLWNKMMRQASVIASMIAQAVCDITGLDMLDNAAPATQLTSFKRMLQIAAGLSGYAVATGTNTYAITLSPAPLSYTLLIGVPIRVKFTNGQTASSCSLNVNALGAKNIARNAADSLFYNDIPANCIRTLVYDGTQFQLVDLAAAATIGQGTARPATVPNTGTPTAIFAAVEGTIQVSFDFGGGNAFTEWVSFYQSVTPTAFGTAVSGTPGTRSYSMSTSVLNMALSGAPGAANIQGKVSQSISPTP
jgi:hypothetical protein